MTADMKLLCPRCGRETAVSDGLFPCESCGGLLRREPSGKAFILVTAQKKTPGSKEAARMVEKAEREADPVRKKRLLDEAAAAYPDALAPQEALLHLGRLWQRNPKQPDYHVIKCYLLHIFDHPEQETPAMREAMLQELTEGPQLQRCLELADDPQAFLRRYMRRLCSEYVRLFLVDDNRRSGRLFGLQVSRMEKSLARPAANMIRNMELAELPGAFAALPECLKEAFRNEVGPTAWLERALEELRT